MNLTHIYFLLIEKSWQTTNLQTGKMETTWDVFLTMIPLTCDMESHVISSLPSDLWQSSRPVWRTKKTWKQLVATKPPNFNKPRRVVGENKFNLLFVRGILNYFHFCGKIPNFQSISETKQLPSRCYCQCIVEASLLHVALVSNQWRSGRAT